jgi:hypothetical protein
MEPEVSLEADTGPYPEPYESNPHLPTVFSFDQFLILFSRLRLGLPSGLFPPGFPAETFYVFLISPMRAAWLAYLIILDMIILLIFGDEHKFWSSSFCSFLQPPVTSSHLDPNFLLSTLFSNILSLCPFLNVRHPHPHKTTGKII